MDNSAGSPLLISVNGECQLVSESICQESVYTMPQATVDGVFAAVQAVSSRSIASPINIIVRYPGTGFSGDWDEDTSTIRITADNTDPYYTAVHEAFHAVSQSPHGQIEHGLVYGMSAIRTGRTGDWHYEGTSIASVDATYTPDGPAVANVVYRIYKKVGEEKAFKFVLDVDKQMPSTMNEAADAMQTIAKQMGISDDVNEALIAVPKGSDWMRQIYAGAISLGMTVEGLDGVLKVIVRDGGLENVEARFWKHMEPYLRERLNDMIAEQGFGERVGGKWDLEDWRLVPPSG